MSGTPSSIDARGKLWGSGDGRGSRLGRQGERAERQTRVGVDAGGATEATGVAPDVRRARVEENRLHQRGEVNPVAHAALRRPYGHPDRGELALLLLRRGAV